jgi:hypothetical protein
VRPAFAFLIAAGLGGCASGPALGNVHEIAPGVFSGAVPHGGEAFRELSRRGVRTVISADGGKPDVDAARRYGLRTVPLPIGYDGIPAERALEPAKALTELPGPFYLHCHHGTAKPADPATLRSLKVEYREIATVPPMAEAMVALDGALENLDLARRAGWKTPADHPDIDPAHEALRAREILTEILRTDDFKARPEGFREAMAVSHRESVELERRLRARNAAADDKPGK